MRPVGGPLGARSGAAGGGSSLRPVARLRIAACQLDTVVGDLDGNVDRMLRALDRAESADCDVAVFTELAVTGYPPEDLLLKPGFVADNVVALKRLAARTGRCAAIVGFVDARRDLYNAAAVCAFGSIQGVYRKRLLPNYSVFDEQRYFAAGSQEPRLYIIGGVRVGVSICEDVWAPTGPMADQAAGGAELVVNLSASPYYAGRLADPLAAVREVYEALVVGTRDYVRKNGFTDVVVGLSGGVDSSLVATIAVDALGPAHVHGVLMPSRYSSSGSVTDAQALADNLGIEQRMIEIEPIHAAVTGQLAASFEGREEDLTE